MSVKMVRRSSCSEFQNTAEWKVKSSQVVGRSFYVSFFL